MTLAACPNQQIVFKLRLTQSPYRSTSIKNETRDLGANGEILVLNYFDTDIQEVAYILNGGSLMFKAKVPKDIESSKVFMRIGGTHANAFCWDADNYAHEAGGTTIIGPITPGLVKKAHRRYYFTFGTHQECALFIYHLFRKDVRLVNKFFAPESVFETDVEPKLRHAVVLKDDDMEEDEDVGRSDEKKDGSDEEEDYDVYAASQLRY